MDREADRALATLELESEYAPLASDARAILRRKTLLGETFVEIATGTASAPKLADGGRLDDARVAKTVELDEVLQTYDPTTRRAFQIWQRELGTAVGERGESVNNALGQLPDFTESGRRPAGGARRAGDRGARARARHRRGLLGASPRTRASCAA